MGYETRLEIDDQRGRRWRGVHRPEFIDLAPLLTALIDLDWEAYAEDGLAEVPQETWQKTLPPSARMIRKLGPNAVHLMLLDAPLVQNIVLKLVHPKRGGARWLTAALRRSRAHRSYLWAHRLRALAIDTPRPLGFLEMGRSPSSALSFGVFEYVEAPTLLQTGAQLGTLKDKRRTIQQVATFLRTMHAQGVFHADLHAENLLVDQERVWVIDLESMRKVRFIHRAALRNLVRLNRDFLDTRAITTSDRLRFLKTYLYHQPDRVAQCRHFWAQVAKATTLKLLERGEAFR